MKVIRAAAMGMCFGVRDALEIIDAQAEPERVTIYGELVHNEEVLADLERRGFRSTDEERGRAIPEGELVLVTAHGLSHRERDRLRASGKSLIDTTCPLVERAHEAALRFHRAGAFVAVVGRADHVEVKGLVGDLEEGRYAVVPDAASARRFPGDGPVGVIFQTTTPPFLGEEVFEAIRAANPGREVRRANTICKPTRDRQSAVEELLDRVEALVVVGGANSNNTRQLAELAARRGVPALRVRNAGDLEPGWFAPYRVVGLTAGTSTLDRTIDEVHEALLRIAAERGESDGTGERGESPAAEFAGTV